MEVGRCDLAACGVLVNVATAVLIKMIKPLTEVLYKIF